MMEIIKIMIAGVILFAAAMAIGLPIAIAIYAGYGEDDDE